MSEQETPPVKEEPTPTPLAEFLEGTAPGTVIDVANLAAPRRNPSGSYLGHEFVAPDIQLHCGSDSCNATMFFRRTATPPDLPPNNWHFFYVKYRCSNC